MTDSPTTVALIVKACPFCISEFPPVLSRDKVGHIVICTGCSALGPTRQTPDEAATAWNTRAGASGEREALIVIPFTVETVDAIAAAALLATGREFGCECPNCRKPVEIGQVVISWADAGEMHYDCDRPFSIDAPHRSDEPEPVILLGKPMQHFPVAALTRSEADEAPGVALNEDSISDEQIDAAIRHGFGDRFAPSPPGVEIPAGMVSGHHETMDLIKDHNERNRLRREKPPIGSIEYEARGERS